MELHFSSHLPFGIRHLIIYSLRGDFSSPLPPPMWRVILGRDIEGNLSGSKGMTMDNFSISVKGWRKMSISHLKHSYLNWRANPCRRKKIAVFHFFLNLAFLIFVWTQSNFSSAWHDNQFFLFFFFLFSFSWFVYSRQWHVP